MSNPAAFRDRTNWPGGFYEQAIEVGSTEDAAIRGGEDSSDWLDFHVPAGALDKTGIPYRDGRPFYRSAVMDHWRLGSLRMHRCGDTGAQVAGRAWDSATCSRGRKACCTGRPTTE